MNIEYFPNESKFITKTLNKFYGASYTLDPHKFIIHNDCFIMIVTTSQVNLKSTTSTMKFLISGYKDITVVNVLYKLLI